MKKILMAVLILVFVASICFAEDYDFRKTRWGMSREEVKATETWELYEDSYGETDEEVIRFRGSIADLECTLSYEFWFNQLISAYYIFRNKSDLLNDEYILFQQILTKKYGFPNYYFSDNSVLWELNKTNVYISLMDGGATLIIMYSGRGLKKLRTELKIREALDLLKEREKEASAAF